jgi:hypothetical protein
MTASDFRPTLTTTMSSVTSDDPAGEDHARADALIGQALFEQLRKTFGHVSRCTCGAFYLSADRLPRRKGVVASEPRILRSTTKTTRPIAYEVSARAVRPISTATTSRWASPSLSRMTASALASAARPRGRIAPVAFGYLPRKGGKANIGTLVFQLLMTPPGPFVGAGGQEDFDPGAWGKTTVPMSRPSATSPGGWANVRCRSSSAARTWARQRPGKPPARLLGGWPR